PCFVSGERIVGQGPPMRISLLMLALCACGDSSSTTIDAPPQPIDARDTDASIDAPTLADVTLGGGANALLWDAATPTLFLTDTDTDRLVEWPGAGGLADAAPPPAETAGVSLGGIVKLADGSFLIANFGFGMQGDLIAVDTSHHPTDVTGLDAARKRIPLAQDSAGKLYTAYFTGMSSNAVGGLATPSVAAGRGAPAERSP